MCITILSFETSSPAVAALTLLSSLLQIRMSDDALDFNGNFRACTGRAQSSPEKNELTCRHEGSSRKIKK